MVWFVNCVCVHFNFSEEGLCLKNADKRRHYFRRTVSSPSILPHEYGFGFMCAGGSVRALPSLHHQYALHAFAIYM